MVSEDPKKFDVLALANTFALIDLILHLFFHIWIFINPRSYEWIMNLFVAGLHLQVTEFDSSFWHIILGALSEVIVVWLLGAVAAILYNKFTGERK